MTASRMLAAELRSWLYKLRIAASPWYRAGRFAEWRRLLDRSQTWSHEQLVAFQLDRLRELVSAAETTRFYRRRLAEAGVSGRALVSLEDLRRLPILDKREIRVDDEALHVPRPPRFLSSATSGSTGAPLRVRTTAEMDAAGRAAAWRMLSWYAVPFGAPSVIFMAETIQHNARLRIESRLSGAMFGRPLPNAFHTPQDRGVDHIVAIRPRAVWAYPSLLTEIAKAARVRGVDLSQLGVRVCGVGGEQVLPTQRRAIAEAFGCSVASLYGSSEGHFMAVECPSGSLHVNEPILLEIVDAHGSVVPDGVRGEVVITPLLGLAKPLLRYRLGDVGRLLPGACDCGSPLPRLDLEVTRQTEMIRLPDGRSVNSQFFQELLQKQLPERFGIDPPRYRVRQRDFDAFTVEIEHTGGVPDEAREFLRVGFERVLHIPLRLELVGVEQLLADRAGKLRNFVPLGESPG
jgi:phenylacetate-CoA ligase